MISYWFMLPLIGGVALGVGIMRFAEWWRFYRLFRAFRAARPTETKEDGRGE